MIRSFSFEKKSLKGKETKSVFYPQKDDLPKEIKLKVLSNKSGISFIILRLRLIS